MQKDIKDIESNPEEMLGEALHELEGKTEAEAMHEMQKRAEFYKQKIFEQFSHQKKSDVDGLLDDKTLIKFRKMTEYEKAAVVSSRVFKSYVMSFAVWSIIGHIAAIPAIGDNLFKRDTIPRRVFGPFGAAMLIQGVSDATCAVSNSLFAIFDALPSYIEEPVLNKSLAHRTRRKRLKKAVKELHLEDRILEKELIKKIGDSAYGFTFLGISKRGIKRKLVRVKDNLLNQLHARPRSTYKTMRDKLIDKGYSKTSATFIAVLKKVGIAVQGFIFGRALSETPEDAVAGLAAGGLQIGVAAIDPFIIAAVAATVSAVFTGISQHHRLDPHKTAAIIALQGSLPIKMIPTQMLYAEGGIKSFIDPRFYLGTFAQGLFRGVGRSLFEHGIRSFIADELGNISPMAVNALYEGFRSGIGQHSMKYLGGDLIEILKQYLEGRENRRELYGKSTKGNMVELSSIFVEHTRKKIENVKEALTACIQFTRDEIMDSEREGEKGLKELKLNWLLSLLNIEQEMERVKEKFEFEIAKLQSSHSSCSEKERLERLGKLVTTYVFKISDITRNAEYLIAILDYYAFTTGKQINHHYNAEFPSEISISEEMSNLETSRDSGLGSSDVSFKESRGGSETLHHLEEGLFFIDDEKSYTEDERRNIFTLEPNLENSPDGLFENRQSLLKERVALPDKKAKTKVLSIISNKKLADTQSEISKKSPFHRGLNKGK